MTLELEDWNGKKKRFRFTYSEAVAVAPGFCSMGYTARAYSNNVRVWFDDQGKVDEVQNWNPKTLEWDVTAKAGLGPIKRRQSAPLA